MFSSSSLQSRRTKNRATQTTQQLVTFFIQLEWFALPIWVARKVIPLGKVYGNTLETGAGLTLDGDSEVPVLDLEQRLFGTTPAAQLPPPDAPQEKNTGASASDPEELPERYLLIVESSQGESIGLPLPSQPALRRFPQSAFKPIPPTYLAQGHLGCAIALVVPSPDDPPIFLLDLDRLIRPQWSLPASDAIDSDS